MADKKFIVDAMLGKLGRWMLLLGYDVIYYRGQTDEELIQTSEKLDRIIITRDTHLAIERKPKRSFLIKSIHFDEQLKKILEEFPLDFSKTLFSRCSSCNVSLEKVEKEKILEELPAKVKEHATVFFRCPKCLHLYWDGTHTIHIKKTLKEHIGLDINPNTYK